MRLNRITFAVASLAFASANPAAAAPPAAAVAASPATVPDNSLRLARLLNPTDKLLDIAMRGFEAGVDAALKKNPEDAAVFDQNPGLLQAIIDAGKPIVRKYVEAGLPAHQQKYAEFYARTFSADEIGQLITFYSSPTGTKVIAGMYSGADLGAFAKTIVEMGDQPVTPEAVHQFTTSAGAKLLPGLDADDWQALFIFAATPAYAKLQATAPEMRQLAADVANQDDPAMNAELDKAVEAAVGEYMAAKKTAGKH
jgi:hypothetical protein